MAAELAGVHPQTLRIYERKGLLRPTRTAGNTRRYSERDIARAAQIQELTQEGVNLAGVKLIIELQAQLDALRAQTDELQPQLRAQDHAATPPGPTAEFVPLHSVYLPPWQAGER